MKKRKVGIVGAQITPDDLMDRAKGFQLWSVNNLFQSFEDVKFSRWYELHDIKEEDGVFYRRNYPNYPIRGEQTVGEYMARLNGLGCPIYMQLEWKQIKRSTIFPFDEIRAKFGDYMGCSFAWMTAQAIIEGVDEIGYFGITLGGNEYYYQRPSVERLIGYCEGVGITVTIDESSDLLKGNYIYAIGEDYDLIYALHGKAMQDFGMKLMLGIQEELDRTCTIAMKGEE